jgi:LysM domain
MGLRAKSTCFDTPIPDMPQTLGSSIPRSMPTAPSRPGAVLRALVTHPPLAVALAWYCLGLAPQALAQPISALQQATAQQTATAGVPLSELAPNAPSQYTVKRGDTLWAISSLFLASAWRWPELWGMNLNDIRNPHRIYPGQTLYLIAQDGKARLSTSPAGSGDEADMATVKVSPRVRNEALADSLIPSLQPHLIEPFLAEPLIVTENELLSAPRIIAATENRVLLTRGDRAYALGSGEIPLTGTDGQTRKFRVFRNATPLKDPADGTILGYEAQFVGKAQLAKPQTTQEITDKDGKVRVDVVAAAIDITAAKEEIRAGDRLLPEPERTFNSYVPHAPAVPITGQIVSVHGSAVKNAAQNQIVVINKGTKDGIDTGQVLAIQKAGAVILDKTQPEKSLVRLPDERNGLMMVFRPFERLSYALILQINDGVKVGDRVVNPR